MNSRARRCVVFVVAFLLSAFAAVAGDLTTAMPYAQGTRRMVLEQLERLLAADPGLQVIGQGSWLRGPVARAAQLSRNYADPLLGGTSDHDLRLVMKGEDGQLLSKWKSVRDQLAEGLQNLFKGRSVAEVEQMLMKNYGYSAQQAAAIAGQGADNVAQIVLKSVNLYPPPQVMRNVVNDKTARALFTRAGAVPSLAGKIVEGVWGEGAPAMIQTFEAQGRLFHVAGGKVRAGFTDLVHMAEGYGKHTMGGYANMAVQWAEKAAEAVHERDAEAAAKYLARLKNNLERARAKGNLGSGVLDDALRELETLIAQAKGGAGVFENPRLAAFLKEAKLNSKLLGELARNPGPMDRQIIEAILGRSSGRLARFGDAMREVWAKADNWTIFERSLQGAFIAWSVMGVADTWGERGMEQALRQAGADVAFLVAAVPGLMATMTNMVLDSAKDAGYELAVSPQHYDDFLAGISSVRGYQGETGTNKTIEQLATEFCSRGEIERFVERQAMGISQLKETGAPQESDATARSREAIRLALIKKMTPLVYREWLRVRKERMTRAIDLELALDDAFNQIIFRVATSPVVLEEGQAGGSAELTVLTDTDWGAIEATLAKIEAEIESLGGRNAMASGLSKPVQCDHTVRLVWTQGSRKQEQSSSRGIGSVFTPQSFTFSTVGQQTVTAEFTLELKLFVGGGADIARDVMDARPLLIRTYQRTIPVAIDVARVSRAKPKPPKATTIAAPDRVGAGDVFTVRIDKRQFPDFKLGAYKLMLVQPGKKLTFEDAALLQFDPTGGTIKPDGVRDQVSVVAERPGSDYVEIDAQVRQVGGFGKAEALDLAFVKFDEKGSVFGELEKATADLEKAQKEMEAAMAKMTPEQLAAMERKMEEAMAKAEKGGVPPPDTADLLPAPPMIVFPIVIRPPQIDLTVPEGWREETGFKGARRSLTREEGRPMPGNHVAIKANFQASLEDGVADRGNGDMAAGTVNHYRTQAGARVVPFQSTTGYKGELIHTAPPDLDDPMHWRRNRSGGAVLRRGDVLQLVQYTWEVEGFRRVERDPQGREIVVYDTRAAAREKADALGGQIDGLFRSMGVSAKTTADEPPSRAGAARGPDSDVRLEAAKMECAPGELIEVASVIDFPKAGDAPYRYEWNGNRAGDGEKVLFLASDPGEYGLGVLVKNSAGKTVGSTSITLKVR
ncbi:coiled-coil domain-containing protein [Horticoccus sp. 23ND18S-11]|uniref:hypothetical protein n=1 Tax=Horticoccus sp. 23ND18S-11 TaxID=3391832 RepID=UPI0039C9FA86